MTVPGADVSGIAYFLPQVESRRAPIEAEAVLKGTHGSPAQDRGHSTANMIRFAFLALYGETEGWKFLQALDKNIHHYTRSGNAPTDLVGRGEFLLGITSDENVKDRLNKGFPLLWTVPEEGIGYDGTFAFILKGTAMADACKKVIDVFGTPEFSKMMAGMGYVTPRPAPNALFGDMTPKYIKLDLGYAAEMRPKWNDVWKEKFRTEFK